MAIIEASNLVKLYGNLRAVDDISLQVQAGQRLGIVGESGSGKSTMIRLISGLSRPTSGEIKINDKSIVGKKERQLGWLRAQLQVVFQDPRSSLDPRMNIGRIITETLRSPWVKKYSNEKIDYRSRCDEVLVQVGLTPKDAKRYPHEFSGGQRQRIAIARALASKPKILIADEAVSALDVSVRAQILNLIDDICVENKLTLIFVSHDLGVVNHLCDQLLVMYQGKIVEQGETKKILTNPSDAYTKSLIAAIPSLTWPQQ